MLWRGNDGGSRTPKQPLCNLRLRSPPFSYKQNSKSLVKASVFAPKSAAFHWLALPALRFGELSVKLSVHTQASILEWQFWALQSSWKFPRFTTPSTLNRLTKDRQSQNIRSSYQSTLHRSSSDCKYWHWSSIPWTLASPHGIWWSTYLKPCDEPVGEARTFARAALIEQSWSAQHLFHPVPLFLQKSRWNSETSILFLEAYENGLGWSKSRSPCVHGWHPPGA